MSWFILVLLSVLVASIGEIGQKISLTSKIELSSVTANFFLGTGQFILSLLFLVLFVGPKEIVIQEGELILLVISSILSFFFFKFFYTSYKGQSASLSQVIFSLSIVLTTFLGILFFNEDSGPVKFLGVFLIFIGVLIASYSKGEKLNKYNIYALIAAVIYSFLVLIEKKFSVEADPHYFQVFISGGFALASLAFAGKTIVKEAKTIDKKLSISLITSAVAFTIFKKLTLTAYSVGGEIGKVDAINNTSILLIIILEILILKDRTSLKKKFFASFLCIVGVLILGYF